MRQVLLSFLRCIHCEHGELELTEFARRDDQIAEGVISCLSCKAVFPVIDGIPRMTPTSEEEHGEFLSRHGYSTPQGRAAANTRTARKTREGFNEQFGSLYYKPLHEFKDDFAQRELRNFFLATETDAASARSLLENKVFLDVGAGGGHYSHNALSFGATVISLDMNDVGLTKYYSAFGGCPRQHAIQASALRMPIKTECVDYAWSMGVLHHTDDLLLGFQEMARALKIGGTHNVGVYYQYKYWPYYAFMRKMTTRLPYFALWPLCHGLASLSYLPRMSFLAHPWVEKGESYRRRVTVAFDHFHPPIQGYYTPEEVASWYAQLECFADVHMTPVWNNFVGRKVAPLTNLFPESIRASIMRC